MADRPLPAVAASSEQTLEAVLAGVSASTTYVSQVLDTLERVMEVYRATVTPMVGQRPSGTINGFSTSANL